MLLLRPTSKPAVPKPTRTRTRGSYMANTFRTRFHLKRLGMEIGAKAAVRLTNEAELSVSYDGAFKEHYRDHTGMINVKIDFRPL